MDHYNILKKDVNISNETGFVNYTKNYHDEVWAKSIVEMGIIKQGRFKDTRFIMENDNHEYLVTKETFNIVAEKVKSYHGVIVEVCAGPAGGFAPAMLIRNPNAKVIISDINKIIGEEWYKVIQNSEYKNTTAMAFNICDMPFINNSIEVVSSRNGFVNIERGTGTQIAALKEIYRVLSDGGLFIMDEIFLANDCINGLSTNNLSILKERYPFIFHNFYQECIDVGFKEVKDYNYSKWNNENDDSGLANLCRKLGVVLEFNQFLRFCIK
jgi:ubiquinone/menaquinone biosynthesis C-methylase UbiE